MLDPNLKTAIKSTFISLFNVKGPALTLEDIATSLHIAKKTIYRFFGSKAAIYEDILTSSSTEILTEQKRIFNEPNLSTKEKLYQILTIRTQAEAQFDVAKLSNLNEYEPAVYQHLLQAYETQWHYFSQLVEIAKKDGTLRPDVSASFLVDVLAKSYESFYQNDFLAKNHLTYTEAVTKVAHLVLDGALKK
jgi:AcrR family transcriptional regulator